jgi:hypothetical protein
MMGKYTSNKHEFELWQFLKLEVEQYLWQFLKLEVEQYLWQFLKLEVEQYLWQLWQFLKLEVEQYLSTDLNRKALCGFATVMGQKLCS